MNKAYNRINWENYPSDSTPLNEDNLNKMDVAINEVDNRVISLDTTKLPVATAYTMVKDVAFDEKTGIFTITKLNGSVIKIDTALEKISTNFRFDYSTQKLILTLIDGTTQEVDLSALLTQYEFTDSDTIAFTIDTSGKVVASVKKGSITQDMLEPNYLANIKVEVAKAESASLSADTSAKNAKTSETNAKTSEEKAREYAEASSGIGALISSFATGTNPTIQDSTNAPLIYGKFKGYTLQDGEPTPDNQIEINGLAKGGAIEVKTCGKNMQYNSDTYDGWIVVGNTTFNTVVTNETYNGGKVLKYTRDWQYIHPPAILYKKGTYTISFDAKATTDGIAYLHELTHAFLTISGDSFKRYSRTFTITEDTNSFIVPVLPQDTTISELYIANIQVEMNTTATPYEPYTETTTAITTDAPLYEGDYLEVYADGSGKLVRKMGVSNSLVLTSYNQNDMTLTKEVRYKKPTDMTKDTTTPFHSNIGRWVQDTYNRDEVGICAHAYGETVSFRVLIDTDVSALAPVIVYPLATPTETPLTAEQLAQFKQLYTFEPVTNVFCDGEVEVLYYKNTDNGETVGIVHKKVEKNERTVNSVNNYYSSFKQNYNTVVGGTVSNNMSNVEYTEPSFSKDGSMYYDVYKGNTLVNGLKSATAKIAETLSSMCDFFIGKIAYNIGGKEIIDDFDYENWITEKSEAVEGAVEYPSNTLERFERLITQCVEASIKLNDSLSWKYLGVTSGKNSITYPSNAQYLKCDVWYVKSNYGQVAHFVEEIDLSRLSDTCSHMFLNGYYYNNTDYASNNIAVSPSSKIVFLVINALNGTDNSAVCTMDVWYR